MPVPLETPPRGEDTRAALVGAALALFGDKGFGPTTTREIAARANANVAMIAYHFGGKEGLRAACADHVAERVREIFAAAGPLEGASAAEARTALLTLARAMIRGLVADDSARPLARFLLREIAETSPAFERVYTSAFAPLHKSACALWARATGGEAESEASKLAVFSLIAQIVYFRIARPPILMRMGWETIGPKEAAAIEAAILFNIDAALGAAVRSRSP